MPSIHIHPILILFSIISFATGTFVNMIIILTIVLIHELGHYLAAYYFKWRIRQVMLWVFGGVMDTDEFGNRPYHEELIVTIAGPFQHLIIYLFLLLASTFSILPASIIELAYFYNSTILIFNLLPIWPLDGGKLLFFLLTNKLAYQKAYHSILIISMLLCSLILIGQIVLFSFTLSSFLIMVFLLMENRSEWKKKHYVFIRFLLNRYNGHNYLKGVSSISVPYQYSMMDVFSLFKRDCKHSIYIQLPNRKRISIDESECLKSYFFDRQYDKSIGEIAQNIAT